MKYHIVLFTSVISFCFSNYCYSQNSLSQELDIFVFPAESQTTRTQDSDEITCYKWAKKQSGVNPANFSNNGVEKEGDLIVRGTGGGAVVGALFGLVRKSHQLDFSTGGFAKDSPANTKGIEDQRYSQGYDNQVKFNQFKAAFCDCLKAKGYTTQF